MKRSIKHTYFRSEIAYHLTKAHGIVDAGTPYNHLSRNGLIRFHLNCALVNARLLPDNPGNRAIRASIVAAIEALNARERALDKGAAEIDEVFDKIRKW